MLKQCPFWATTWHLFFIFNVCRAKAVRMGGIRHPALVVFQSVDIRKLVVNTSREQCVRNSITLCAAVRTTLRPGFACCNPLAFARDLVIPAGIIGVRSP